HSAGLNPLAEYLDLFPRQRWLFPRHGRFGSADGLDKQAIVGLAGLEQGAAPAALAHVGEGVHSELAFGLRGRMAAPAMSFEDRLDVVAIADFRLRRPCGQGHAEKQARNHYRAVHHPSDLESTSWET